MPPRDASRLPVSVKGVLLRRGRVLLLTYACRLRRLAKVGLSHEHDAHAWLPVAVLAHEPIPRGYLRGIRRAAGRAPARATRAGRGKSA